MKKTILILLLVSLLFACQTNDDIPITYQEGTNEYENEWIYSQMKRYYYWNESMPGKGNLSLDSKAYFKTLLHTDDPFSYAIHTSSAETFPNSLGRSFGFDVSFVEYEGQVFGVVLYVLSDSPAENSGLHRGQLITAIGSATLNQENCDSLYQNLIETENANLKVVEYFEESGFASPQQVTIHQGLTFLQPIRHQVITEQNNNIGYIEIPHFDIGLSQLLLQTFQDFKNQDVTEIVVDLRYNGGGDVSSATALSILLSPNILPSDPFITFKGNSNGGQINQTFKEALEMNESQVKNGITAIVAHLEKQGIATVLRQNAKGDLYGITYVDHITGCVCNGSSLGKAYSAKGILERCGEPSGPQKFRQEFTNQQPFLSDSEDSGFAAEVQKILEVLSRPEFTPGCLPQQLKGKKKKRRKGK